MTSSANRNRPWIERPVFWTIILVVLFFLLGVGLGARLAMLGVSQQLAELELQNTNQTSVFADASGEVAGTVSGISAEQISVVATNGQTYTFQLTSSTELFAFIGESTPLLPGEVREKSTLTMADLQPNDTVVVRYTEGQQAVSIQKIR